MHSYLKEWLFCAVIHGSGRWTDLVVFVPHRRQEKLTSSWFKQPELFVPSLVPPGVSLLVLISTCIFQTTLLIQFYQNVHVKRTFTNGSILPD